MIRILGLPAESPTDLIVNSAAMAARILCSSLAAGKRVGWTELANVVPRHGCIRDHGAQVTGHHPLNITEFSTRLQYVAISREKNL